MIDNLIVAILTRCSKVINDWAKRLTITEKAKALSHILAPALLLGVAIYSGGWVAIGFERAIAISELRTEITDNSVASTQRGFVVIAEPEADHYKYVIPFSNGSSKIWNSLDEGLALDNAKGSSLLLIPSGLQITTPLVGVYEPMTLVIHGDLGQQIEIVGHGKQPIADWRVSSRRPLSLIAAVLLNCSLALGIGIVTGFPSINPNENNARKVSTQPDKE